MRLHVPNSTSIAHLLSKVEGFKASIACIDAVMLNSDSIDDLLADVCSILRETPGYTGVYVYALREETLVLSAFEGRQTEHIRISPGEGVCGASVKSREIVVVDDVGDDPRYLACNLETKSEIIVPITRGDAYLAQINIDSDDRATFGPLDRAFLLEVAAKIAPLF